jgi:hypothetical protein
VSSLDYLAELAAVLDRLVPADGLTPDWDDVVRRAGMRRGRRIGRRRLRLALAVALLLLLLTAVATATYIATRAGQPPPSVAALDAGGSPDTLWQCTDKRCAGLV